MQADNDVLRPECEAELRCWDMYAVAQEGTEIVEIRDTEDAGLIVRVTATISAYDLKSLLRHGQKAMNLGVEAGERALAAKFRALMNASEKS